MAAQLLSEAWSQRQRDLQQAFQLASAAVHTGEVPELSAIPPSVVFTSAVAILVSTQLLVVMLIPRSRKMVLDAIETIVAVALIVVLLGVVLGLPFGAVYIGGKGVRYAVVSLLHNFPALRSALKAVLGAVGLQGVVA